MAPPVNRDVLIGVGPLTYIQPVPQGPKVDNRLARSGRIADLPYAAAELKS
jgi:hypothetical protein